MFVQFHSNKKFCWPSSYRLNSQSVIVISFNSLKYLKNSFALVSSQTVLIKAAQLKYTKNKNLAIKNFSLLVFQLTSKTIT